MLRILPAASLSLLCVLTLSLPAIARSRGRVISLEEAAESSIDLSAVRFIQDAEEANERKTLMLWNSSAEQIGGPPGWDEPLASDRPDFTEASCTVGRGVCQLEMGYTYFHDNDGATSFDGHSLPEMLLRIGVLADWLELRIAWNFGREQLRTGGVGIQTSGFDDLYVGLKLGLTPQQGILPEMALMPQMSVPLGSAFSANRVLPGVNWLYGWEINDFLTTAGSTQLNLSVDPTTGNEYTEFAQSWTIGYSLAEKLGMYTEWFVFSPAGADTARTEHYLDAGLTYSVSNNLQLDVRIGKGVSAAAVDLFAGAGLVSRF
ncbi:transporter [Anatilimnocola floriformis]|uniref:transporter n=1 Tax=Anatilimnocola floriformis TaxID=2948575 RepID=UPI0020C53CDA|nr:transporter [Anatilimnocola floriformis]